MKILHTRLLIEHLTSNEEVLKMLPELSKKIEKLTESELEKKELSGVKLFITTSAMSMEELKAEYEKILELIK